jgi:hypothetical protein
MSSLVPIVKLPYLPPNTIVPKPSDDEETFVQYFMRLYEDIAFAVNARDFVYFPISVTDTPTNIPNIPNFGSFVICISGVESGQPTSVLALTKSDRNVAGLYYEMATQSGTGTWAGKDLNVTATATNFQIEHNNTGVVGNFNVRIIGTQ